LVASAKVRTIYTCQRCGVQFPKWSGQCSDCGSWNTLAEDVMVPTARPVRYQGYASETSNKPTLLSEVALTEIPRISTQLPEFDLVLGGGLVAGSIILIGGDPGIGKSTLLLQTLCQLSISEACLYVTGEESLQQVTLRAKRLNLPQNHLQLLAETHVEKIIQIAAMQQPKVIVIDSIQTIFTENLPSAPGGVSQVRESAAQLVQYAKQSGCILMLVGHVTKEGVLAGPRVLEHMVDTVLYFEGESDNRYRIIRAVKNRFGAVNELAIFAMTDKGLRQVNNPSAIFLAHYQQMVPGSSVMVTFEGSRPLLVEIQALVDQSHLANPRRVTVGFGPNRLAMLLAALHRHGGVATHHQDVFVNVVGGVKVTETGIDLALLLAVLSSLKNKPLTSGLIVFGEVGLAGEIRPVQCGQERLREAAKHGFKTAIVPKANAPKKGIEGLQIMPVNHLREAIELA
jgi:DNA repair protein RadA/Sms